MKKNCAIIAGMSNAKIKQIIEAISLKALAEESDGDGGENTNGTDSPNGGAPAINYEDLIAKARKEEKDKQYKTIEKYKVQINTLTEQHNGDLLKIADLEKKLTDAEAKLTSAGSGDSEEIKTLKETIKTLTKDKEDLEKKVKDFVPVNRDEVEAEVRKELEAEYEVKTYKATKMAELKDQILVPELVMGSTKEEIDSSIQQALNRSAEIKKSLGIDDSNTSKSKQKRTPSNPTNPSVSPIQDKEISLEYLASLDVSSPEYAQVRKQLGLK